MGSSIVSFFARVDAIAPPARRGIPIPHPDIPVIVPEPIIPAYVPAPIIPAPVPRFPGSPGGRPSSPGSHPTTPDNPDSPDDPDSIPNRPNPPTKPNPPDEPTTPDQPNTNPNTNPNSKPNPIQSRIQTLKTHLVNSLSFQRKKKLLPMMPRSSRWVLTGAKTAIARSRCCSRVCYLPPHFEF